VVPPHDGVVARRQIARVLVRSLSSAHALRKTFELVAERGQESTDMDGLFATAVPDEAGPLDGVRGPKNMPLEREPSLVREELGNILPSKDSAIRIQTGST
jgi:hypothetical protein